MILYLKKKDMSCLKQSQLVVFLRKSVVPSTTMRFLQQLVECGNQDIHKLLRYNNSFNLSGVFTNYTVYVFYDFR